MPKRGEKRWVRKKGCKNCAEQWVVDYIDDEGVEYGTWLIVPMVPGKPFRFVSKLMKFKNNIPGAFRLIRTNTRLKS